jgi:hypothetical protein
MHRSYIEVIQETRRTDQVGLVHKLDDDFIRMLAAFFTMIASFAPIGSRYLDRKIQPIHDAIRNADAASTAHRNAEERTQTEFAEHIVSIEQELLAHQSIEEAEADLAAHCLVRDVLKRVEERHLASGVSDEVSDFKVDIAEQRIRQIEERIEKLRAAKVA